MEFVQPIERTLPIPRNLARSWNLLIQTELARQEMVNMQRIQTHIDSGGFYHCDPKLLVCPIKVSEVCNDSD